MSPINADPDATDSQLFSDLPSPIILPPSDIYTSYETVNVLAPLVRCSKLPFRHLTSLYETHITHTPMILAQEFSRAQIARTSDFSTSSEERGVFWMEPRRDKWVRKGKFTQRREEATFVNGDQNENAESEEMKAQSTSHPEDQRMFEPITYHKAKKHTRLPPTPIAPTKHSQLVRGSLIGQFASPNPTSLADAAELISPYVDGLDINCGCPQKWAYHEGIGCALLRKPELVRDMVRTVHDRMGWGWPVSIKIRVDPDLKLTDQLVRTALQANISHLTIHGRTRHQPSTDPVNLPGIAFAVECARGEVPCVANGDLWSLEDANRMREETGVQGVMAARGLLANPALFAGYQKTPEHCLSQFLALATDYTLTYQLFHRHIAYMMESHFTRPERIWFNSLTSQVAVMDHLRDRGVDWNTPRGTIWDARRGRNVLPPTYI